MIRYTKDSQILKKKNLMLEIVDWRFMKEGKRSCSVRFVLVVSD